MRDKHTCVLLALLLISGADIGAQERQVITTVGVGGGDAFPLPMPGRQFKTGTGRIRGRVVAVDTGAPVRRAQVRLTGADIAPKTALTDAQGQFEFNELPASRFNLSASKSGFVTIQYGQTRPFESGKPIELADTQVLDKVSIVMPRGSAISGRIVDEFGEPVADAAVSAMRSVWTGGRRRLQATGRIAQTNDLGQYRIYGLPPGEYYVSATLRGGEMEMMRIEMVAAAIGGGGGGASSPPSGYPPTYFPGTTSATDAQRVQVTVGQDLQGADFSLTPVRLAKVSGMVLASDGKPTSGATVELLPRSSEGLLLFGGNIGRTDRNGAFTISGVSPGDYNLIIRSINVVTSGGGDNITFSARIGGPGGEDAEFGSVPVTVTGDDLTSVIVTTAKGATATGRVTFEGGEPQSLGSIRITTSSTDGSPTIVMPMMAGGPGNLKEDGSFELRGLVGNRLIRAIGLPPGWTLKSVRVEGTDVTDTGFDFKAGAAVSGIDIVVSSKVSGVTGMVAGANGQPVSDYTVVLFSDDPSRWTLPSSRYVVGTRGDQDGRFKVASLPPGDYYAIAVEYIAQGEWGDPQLLERLRDKATRFTLNEGQSQTLNLKLTATY